MAKYRRRRYRRRSSRWSPNIVKIANLLMATSGEFFNYEDLAVNPIQTTTGISQRFTVKNVELAFSLHAGNISTPVIESVTAYVMYVPQGYTVTSTLYADHPEWIMAYKFLGQPYYETSIDGALGQQFQPYKIRTRLSRKLDTGDRLILFIQGSNESENIQEYKIDGIVRWWSKAN